MRTTVEIPDRLRAALHATAAQRGYRGFSKLVEEALDLYFARLAETDEQLALVVGLKGSWSDEDADEARDVIRDLRELWNEGAKS